MHRWYYQSATLRHKLLQDCTAEMALNHEGKVEVGPPGVIFSKVKDAETYLDSLGYRPVTEYNIEGER